MNHQECRYLKIELRNKQMELDRRQKLSQQAIANVHLASYNLDRAWERLRDVAFSEGIQLAKSVPRGGVLKALRQIVTTAPAILNAIGEVRRSWEKSEEDIRRQNDWLKDIQETESDLREIRQKIKIAGCY